MTQERQPTTKKDTRVRNAGIGVGLVLAGALAGGALSGSFRSEPARNTDSSSQNPSATELATSRPSEAGAEPSGSPEPSSSAEMGVNYSPAGHYSTGEFATVKAGDYLIADVELANFGTPHTEDGLNQFVPAFDTDKHHEPNITDTGKTGTMVHLDQDAEVYFPYGGDVVDGSDIKNPDIWVAGQIRDIKNGGCGQVDGCSQGVGINNKPIEWTGMDTTMLPGGILAKDLLAEINQGLAGATPSGSPRPSALPDFSSMTYEQQLLWQIDQIRQELAKCGVCETPPPPCPSASPKPSETPSAACPEDDHRMKQGEVYKLPVEYRAIVQADAIIDAKFDKKGKYIPGTGIRTYDSKDKTGAISQILDGKSHTIYTPEGERGKEVGDVQVFCPTTTLDIIAQWYENDLNALKGAGRTLDPNSAIIK